MNENVFFYGIAFTPGIVAVIIVSVVVVVRAGWMALLRAYAFVLACLAAAAGSIAAIALFWAWVAGAFA